MTNSSDSSTTNPNVVVTTPQPSLINIAASHQLPITLTAANFTSWRTHLCALLDGLDLHGYLTDKTPCPNAETDAAGATFWFRQDRLLLAAILGSVSAEILPLLSTASTSADAWETLNCAFASTSRAHVMHLKTSLTKATLGSRTVTDYVHSIKVIADELGLIDTPISKM